MNEFETQLISQLTRIADVLELIQDNDTVGSLAGIELCLSRVATEIEKTSDQ
jgi:hypothetical protein